MKTFLRAGVVLVLVLSMTTLVSAGVAEAAATCNGQTATIVGTSGADDLVGTDGADVIVSFGGADTIDAGAGDDVVCSGGGDDTIDAGEGDDYVKAGAGNDVVFGGLDDDKLLAQDGDDLVFGDRASCFNRSKFQTPVSCNNTTQGGNDVLFGGSGNDTLVGDPGRDRIYGGADDDRLFAGFRAEDDRLFGGGGQDELYTPAGTAVLFGGDGDDLIDARAQQDSVFRLFGQDGNDDFVFAADSGSNGKVEIFGGDGDDTVGYPNRFSYAGDLTFFGSVGNDTVDGTQAGYSFRALGGGGNDTIAAPIEIDSSGSVLIDGGLGDDVLGSIANVPTEVEGRAGSDYLIGRGLRGGTGNDVLFLWSRGGPQLLEFGNEGNDVIVAAPNNPSKVLAKDGDDVVFVYPGFTGIVWGGNGTDACGGSADSDQLNCELDQATVPSELGDPSIFTNAWWFLNPDIDLPGVPGPGPGFGPDGQVTVLADSATVGHAMTYAVNSEVGLTAEIEAVVNGVTTKHFDVITQGDVDFGVESYFNEVPADSSGFYRIRWCDQGNCGLWGPELMFDYTVPPCSVPGYVAAGATNATTHSYVQIQDLLDTTQELIFGDTSTPVTAADTIEIVSVLEGALLLDVNGTLGWADAADYSLTAGGPALDLADLSSCARLFYYYE